MQDMNKPVKLKRKIPTTVPAIPSAAEVRAAIAAVEAGDIRPGVVVLTGLALALDRRDGVLERIKAEKAAK